MVEMAKSRRCGYRKSRKSQRGAGLGDWISSIFSSDKKEEEVPSSMPPQTTSISRTPSMNASMPPTSSMNMPPQSGSLAGGRRKRTKRSTKRKH